MAVDWQQRLDFDKLRKDRVEKANEKMKEYGIGALLLFGWDSMRYTSGIFIHSYHRHLPTSPVLLIRDAGFPYHTTALGLEIFCPWLKDRLVSADVLSFPGVWHVITSDMAAERWGKTAQQIKALMKKHGVADLPLGIDWTGPRAINAFEKAGIKVVDGNEAIMEARMVKTDEEVELMRQAATCAEAGYGEVLKKYKIGMTELDVWSIMQDGFTRAGAEYAEGYCIGSGPRPHSISFNVSDRIIRPGEFLNIEACHVTFCGYKVCYDRTFIVGQEPNKIQRELYQAFVETQYKFQKTLRPGITTHELYKERPFAANEFSADLKKYTLRGGVARGQGFHGIGSGWGTAPRPTDKELPIVKGMAFCAHTQGWLEHPDGSMVENTGISIENTYITTDTGWENFDKWPWEELIVLGR